ncbi:hypothetical protein B0T10DRAFT_600897 [Thelonectria olida]|uniref:Zn(2)-C6 fungal-type domain-containing protein n=1 Tax=Thelonectria olida TaxID=1576542 RepID=A0A9P9AZU8_9HYPO|nr:hypothetical protein B0T10DRAFT_600897 [Thelonectria olida]
MDSSPAHQSPDALTQASQACRQCSRLKRKCKRELPSCSLCVRLGKACNYPSGRKPYGSKPSAHTNAPSSLPVLSGRREATTAPPFPDAFFLDNDLFQSISHSSLSSAHSVPPHISQLLGPDIDAICDLYFNSIDTWFPFISKKRLHQSIQANLPTETASLALLLLCTKLVSETPQLSATDSKLYKAVKAYVVTVEELSPSSLHLFQSLVLVALYELGHGIFPAAYLTVGRAARLGILRGVHDRKNVTQLFKTPPSWTYWEEERRTWWAASILERFLNLGPKGFPLAFPEPAQGELLPTTDAEFCRGEIGTSQALYTTGFSPASEIGPFARVCQVSHILGRVISHRDYPKDSRPRKAILDEALQLDATLTALDNYLSQAAGSGEAATPLDVALCVCARLALYHMYACNIHDPSEERLTEESTMQSACIVGLQQIMGPRGAALARCVLTHGVDRSSPLIAQSLYDIATECQWFLREGDMAAEGAAETMQLLMEALSLLAQRWEIGSKCLRLLNQSDGQ